MYTGNSVANAIDDSHRFENREAHYEKCFKCGDKFFDIEDMVLINGCLECKDCIAMALEIKIHSYMELLDKAIAKRRKVFISKAIQYEVAGGYFTKQKDLLTIEAMISRIENRIMKLIESI